MAEDSRRITFPRKSATKLAFFVVLVAAAIYWFRFSPVAVATHVISEDKLTQEVMGTGTLEARISATISPKISGRIARVLVDQGDTVVAGQLLVRLDDEELRQQVAIAEANVEAAVAAIERLKTDKARANVILTQAQKNFDRIDSLRKRDATSEGDLDQAAEALGVAMADVARSEAGINEGQKGLIAAEKNLEYHRARQQDTRITAPFDGLVVDRNRELGDVVVPGSSILTLISTDELWISAWVDETQMGKLAEGQTADVVFRSQPQRVFPGTVSRLGREADRETREFIVDVRVLEMPKNWAVGQRAEVFIKIAELESVVVISPEFLVRGDDGDEGAFVIRDGRANWRMLKLGTRGRSLVQVLDGVKAGDLVAKPVNNRSTLRDGQGVSPR